MDKGGGHKSPLQDGFFQSLIAEGSGSGVQKKLDMWCGVMVDYSSTLGAGLIAAITRTSLVAVMWET
jgi:hypothetical protein